MLHQVSYILLDAARLGDQINEAIRQNKTHDSLYRGGPEQKLTSVAPYVFSFRRDTDFGHWFMEQGWGDSWGVLLQSSYSLPDLYKHFRKFIKVNTENGGQMYFRFYDPRVLRVFLPTCDANQLREFFGPVTAFLVEDEDPTRIIRYSQTNGVLNTQFLALADHYTARPKPAVAETDAPEAEGLPASEAMEPVRAEDPPVPPKKQPDKKASKWNMFD